MKSAVAITVLFASSLALAQAPITTILTSARITSDGGRPATFGGGADKNDSIEVETHCRLLQECIGTPSLATGEVFVKLLDEPGHQIYKLLSPYTGQIEVVMQFPAIGIKYRYRIYVAVTTEVRAIE